MSPQLHTRERRALEHERCGVHAGELRQDAGESDNEIIGPMPPAPTEEKQLKEREYGSQLLPGEGTAMAAFVQDGQRIPRRGEIGLDADQLSAFERAGFVMSGSRHERMNEVRVRKENQVISAEERREMLKAHAEERAQREAEIIGQFREMVHTLQGQRPS